MINNMVFNKIKKKIELLRFGEEYIATNNNVVEARKMGVQVGEKCRIYSLDFSSEPYLVKIGDHVTVTYGVRFATHDGGVWVFREKYPDIELFGKISIGNNVFIGINSIILFNTIIGDNCIIAAGSVLKGDFENNSIIAGVPAKKIASVDEYYKKNLSKFLYTKNMTAREKKHAILMNLNKEKRY